MAVLSREERQGFRAAIKAAEQEGDEELAEAIRAERRGLREERRAERREEGKAPDQVLGKALSDVWNEDKAKEFVKEDLTDLSVAVLSGELSFSGAVGEALDALAEDADDLLDFSGVPMVGFVLEMVDGPLFSMFIRDSLRPWVEAELANLLKKE